MKQRTKWETDFRNALLEHQEPLPSGSWDVLEKSLQKENVTVKASNKRLYHTLWISVASVAAVAVFLWWKPWSQVTDLTTNNAKITNWVVQKVGGEKASIPSIPEEPNFTRVVEKRLLAIEKEREEKKTVTNAHTEEPVEVNGKSESLSQKEERGEGKEKPTSLSRSVNQRSSLAFRSNQRDLSIERIQPVKRIALALSTSYLGGSSNGYAGYSAKIPWAVGAPGAFSNNYSQIIQNNLGREVHSHIKHKMPVNAALLIRIPVAKRWAVESGLSYTYLSSDLQSGSDFSYCDTEQRLHFLGIPVKVNYQFFDSRWISLYVSAGGMVEMCVSGKQNMHCVVNGVSTADESRKVGRDVWQSSLSAAVGAQINVLRKMSVFVEPGMVYYFDNSSSLETLRSEHPLGFNMQFGVRLTY